MRHTKVEVLVIFFLVLLSTFKSVANPSLELVNRVRVAQNALIQGELSLANNLINKVKHSDEYEFHTLEVLYLLESNKTSRAIEKLTALEKQFSERADTFSFSSEAWRVIGHQSSLFSKRKYYKKAVQSKIKAGLLAPESGRFLTMRASALGQSKSYGGDPDEQINIVRKIIKVSEKWGYIARINLAQNNVNFSLAHQISLQAINKFPNDFDVLERVAQLHWTTDNEQQAQAMFAKACHSMPISENWYQTVKWIDACYQVAIFAREEGLDRQLGVQALSKLFEEYKLPTESNFEMITLYASLAKQSELHSIKPRLQQLINRTDNTKLKTDAKKLLATINKSTDLPPVL
ncbi:hypothetical protein CS022_14010 [Veronia nyctiphanis]|uniref:Uncharacterized protein n=1 Tax=Veronia nyctiphanis TaxID=1278244 RepID=A0A4Q0YP95_9GAMM|nr:hypothetical protein [Veronia nyctiphanis]RXJ72746.1 hypothetical protein CS022_14010 [Veronia nyctiphanis]